MFFFFKQKTAYEMRISDWSSDVCSSDLAELHRAGDAVAAHLRLAFQRHRHGDGHVHLPNQPVAVDLAVRHVERTHHAREGAVETVPGTDDGQHAVLVAHRGLRHAIIGAVHCCHSTSDRKSTRLNSSHQCAPSMPSPALIKKTN